MPYRRRRVAPKRRPRRAPFRRFKRRFPKRGNLSAGNVQTNRFKRSKSLVLGLNPSGLPTGWVMNSSNTVLSKAFTFALGDLTSNADFTNLYKEYMLTGVALTMYFSNSSVSTDADSTFANSNIIVRYDSNRDGLGAPTEAEPYLESQTSKSRAGINAMNKPIRVYVPLNQINMKYRSSGTTGYTISKPQFISTTDVDLPHYGLNMMLQRTDNAAFTSGWVNHQSVRLDMTYYLKCRKVQ